MLYCNLQAAKTAYQNGENVTSYLRRQFGSAGNTPEIIEIAYDLQAGSYIESIGRNRAGWQAYTREIGAILAKHLTPGDVLLDVGTGEMTTLAGVVNQCCNGLSFYACDISLSRLLKGNVFLARELPPETLRAVFPFVADLFTLPFMDNAVDVVWTSHALEPNGGREKAALAELIRVARKKLVLFEPYFEKNSPAGQERMARLGYIKGVREAVEELGATCEEIIPIANLANPLNPTHAFIVTPPTSTGGSDAFWACPATRLPMERIDDLFWSKFSMLAYPVLRGIPVLRPEAAILASALG